MHLRPDEWPVDPFDDAARLFSFTPKAPTEPEPPASAPPSKLSQQPAGTRKGAAHSRTRAVFFSAHVLGLVALMTVGMTVDAEALPHEHVTPTSITDDGVPGGDIQAYVTPAQTQPSPVVSRDGYSTATLVDLAGTVGITNYSSAVFTNNPDCAVQWPYAVGVPMTYGFGMRDGRLHQGTDFVPGAGAHIQAIADGIVSIATDNGGAYGVTIVIDHLVDGQLVSSRYAHMEYDSRQVEVGDTVSVGQYIGRTGDTGRSFGAHLHFEILRDGTTATDPLPWLQTYAAC
ncbi:peptidase M23-like protein [Microbacterium sp. AG1240]|uniref:M23 family metallopeptidase n=1 Tax=Microbacterium sp. AG1240 TaxID=2183992 RepID=UPI000EAF4287|nr:M23 family metallopeptidase [Microbacterium sp. AG1240]RKT36817.1 peptidase M23-like protein [Microbacterium sp. AG1240]